MMTMQLTLHRGHYTGHWVENNAECAKEVAGFLPPRRFRFTADFFNDKDVTHLRRLHQQGVAYQISLCKVMADHEEIQEDIESI